MCQLAEADPAQEVPLVDRPSSAASPATRVRAHPELRLLPLLVDQCLLRHPSLPSPLHQLARSAGSPANGNPNAASNARPSPSVRAVVTMVMSIPRTFNTLA